MKIASNVLAVVGLCLLALVVAAWGGWFLFVGIPIVVGIALAGNIWAAIWCAAVLGFLLVAAAGLLGLAAA